MISLSVDITYLIDYSYIHEESLYHLFDIEQQLGCPDWWVWGDEREALESLRKYHQRRIDQYLEGYSNDNCQRSSRREDY